MKGVEHTGRASYQKNNLQSSSLTSWRRQLVTKEDPYHVHKTLGLLCLGSFVFRLSQMEEYDSDMGFRTQSEWTLPTIALHLLLNISSFMFHIPRKRIASGYRIWPEYRLHSLVFLVRSLAVIGLYWYEETYQRQPNYEWNLVIVIGAMMAADLSSQMQGSYQSNSIRDLEVPVGVKFLFSVAQFFGTANVLFGFRRCTMHMLFAMIVQINAFLMTVRRKNLVSQGFLVTLYGISLLAGASRCGVDYWNEDERIFYIICSLVHIAVVQRMAPWPVSVRAVISNKYIVWVTFYSLARQLRPALTGETVTASEMSVFFWVTFVIMWGLGLYRSLRPTA